MKRFIRNIVGIIFIICGLGTCWLSLTLFPHPLNWGTVFIIFTPVLLTGLAFIASGWGIMAGMSWRELFDDLTYLWH